MNARLLFVHALSPLHAGTGQGVGVIDLPIAREKATGLPYLPGSSLKGTLRGLCQDHTVRKKVFGPETTAADEHAGAAQFSDQRLLLMPIRSLAGTFAWVTSPYVLRRLLRDARAVGKDAPAPIPSPRDSEHCFISDQDCCLCFTGESIVLEDLDLLGEEDPSARAWAEWIADHVFPDDRDWKSMLVSRFCVVHDDVFSFLLETATEITARVKLLEDLKTVQKGGLWYEESLPAETILSGLVAATPVAKTGFTPEETLNAVADLTNKPAQFGGKATVGRGVCMLQMAK